MADNVVFLHKPPQQVSHHLRVGFSGHRQLDALAQSGRLPVSSVVFDAAAFAHQRDLAGSVAEAGGEIILDTNCAELSSIGRFEGAVRSAPWANPDGVLSEDFFVRKGNFDLFGRIARFAVEVGVHGVLAPSHYLADGSVDKWLQIDAASCVALREALDREGGKKIAIDYPLMIKMASLRDPIQRRRFIGGIKDLPFDNLWLRISGFGSNATAMAARRYIASATEFHKLERPIISDGVGGLIGLAIAAFGTAGGVCHGAAEKERFDASSWAKPKEDGGGGGREKRILVVGMDRLLSQKQADAIMSAPGARKLLSCNDPSCCVHGYGDTIKLSKGHFLYQRAKQLGQLSKVPEQRRVQYFLDHDLKAAAQTSQKTTKLKGLGDFLNKLLDENFSRLDKMRPVFEDLYKRMNDTDRSLRPVRRPYARNIVSSRRR